MNKVVFFNPLSFKRIRLMKLRYDQTMKLDNVGFDPIGIVSSLKITDYPLLTNTNQHKTEDFLPTTLQII